MDKKKYLPYCLMMDSPSLKLLLSLNDNRNVWVHPIYEERERSGEFHTLFPKLLESPKKFNEYFRMSPETYYYVLNRIKPHIEKHNNFRKCISAEERLALTLRFLSTGLAFRSLSFSYRIAHFTIAKIIYETCDSIWQCFVDEHMPYPSKEILLQTAKDYEQLWNYPNCVGSIDGKHVRIKCPKLSGSRHFNYKQYHSLVLQALVDAKYKFLSVDFGAYGRESDSGVFARSNMYDQIERGSFSFPQPRELPGSNIILPYVFIGDQGYPLKEYLMRPYTSNGDTVPREVEIYNYRHSRARRTVECAFGILVAKWRCLKTELQVSPEHVDKIVLCACILHNIVIDKEGISAVQLQQISSNALSASNEGSSLGRSKRFNRSENGAYNVRDSFKNYFNNEGAIDFQYSKIDTYIS